MKNGVKADFGTNLRTTQDNQSVIGKLPGNFSKIEIFFFQVLRSLKILSLIYFSEMLSQKMCSFKMYLLNI